MKSHVRVRRSALALLAAALLAILSVAGALANAPDPGSISGSVDGQTARVSGTWSWPGIDKCEDRWVGWAIDWGDPADRGNAVANGFSVGTGNDNTVHTSSSCGSSSGGTNRSGYWGPLTHTYTSGGTYRVCAITYAIHLDPAKGTPKDGELIAGGSARNKDNSVETNGQGPSSPGCTNVTITTPAKVATRMTVNRTTADPGDMLTYSIVLSNGGSAAGSVDVTDDIGTLLAHGSFVSASNGGSLSGNTVSWKGVNVPGNGSTTLTTSVRLATGGWPVGTTTLQNTVVVPGTNCASGSGNADCRTTTTVSATLNLVVRKSVNATSADPGDTLTYSIAIQNTGNVAATGVSASDAIGTLLSHGSFVSATSGGSLNGSTVTWSGLSVDAGATTTVGFSVRLDTGGWVSGTTSLPNTAVVPNSDCASGSSNSNCRTSTTVSVAPNLVVRKSVNTTSADPGDTLSYTIGVENTGNAAASNVAVSDNIGALLEHGSFVSASGGGSLGGSTVSWPSFGLDAGASRSLTFSVRLDTGGWTVGTTNLPNTVVVPGSDCASGSSNSACRVSTAVTARVNLVVRKSVNTTSADPGDTLSYTISVQNTGNVAASNVDVSDDITALLAHGSFVSASGNGSLGGSTVRWSNLTVGPGATQTLTFSVRLDAGGWATGTTNLANTVVVPGSDCASGSSNAACRVSTAVTARPNLVVRKSVNTTSADPGDTLSYTIGVENTGNAAASNVAVSDNIGALLEHGSFVSASGGGSLGGSTVSWPSFGLDAGASRSLTFSVRLDTGGWTVGTTNLPNTVVVPGSDCASGSSNSACRVSTAVTARVNLVVRKSVNTTSADPGDTLSYTISVQNTGNVAASNVDVSDDITALLAHGSFVSASGNGSLGGSTVRWSNLTVGPGATQTLTFSVRLDAGGWATGTTNLANTVVVPGSDCASGSSNAACRVSTAVTARYSLTLTKGASGGSSGPWVATLNTTAGDTAWYQVRVTNAGNATLSGVTVTDSQGIPSGQCAAVPSTLAPGDGWTCVYFRTATEGTTTNTATADSAQTSASSSTATVVAAPEPAPAIRISKSATPAQLPVGGGNVSFTFLVSNPGNVALSSVAVSDDGCAPLTLQSGDANGNGRLEASETWRYTCGATLTATKSATATAAGTYGSRRVTDSVKLTVTVLVAAPAIHLEKTARPAALAVGGGTAAYTYVVTNVGNAALANVTVTDDRCSPVTYVSGDGNSNERLDLTETWRFACSTTLTLTTTNTARATGSAGGTAVSDTDVATVTVASSQPGIRVVKAANPASMPPGGGAVTYTYVVTNTGNTPLTSVALRDDTCDAVTFQGGDTDGDSRLDTGETWQYRCAATVTSTTTNTVTASGRAGTATVTDTDTATVAVTASNAAINVAKTASVSTLAPAGGPVTYTYVLTNKGNVALTNVSVVDDKCESLARGAGDTNGNSRLDTTETWTYTCTATLTESTTNTALATGSFDGMPVTDTDTALVTVGTPAQTTPRIGLTLTATPNVLPETGGSVTWSYAVSNKGDVALENVKVADDTCASIGTPSGDANGNAALDLAETWVFTCVMAITQDTTSTATASGDADGQTVTALDTATVTVTPPAPTPTPTESPTPSAGKSTAPGGSAGAGSPGASSGTVPGGAVGGATSPPKESQPPAADTVNVNEGQTPSAPVLAIVLMLGIAAAGLILTLGRRNSAV